MKVEEVNNRSTQHTIRDIAESTTKDQAVAHRFERGRCWHSMRPSQAETIRPSG
jgi:hypothetical protein